MIRSCCCALSMVTATNQASLPIFSTPSNLPPPDLMILTKDEDIELIRRAGKLAGEVLEAISKMAAPGMTTWELDEHAEKLIREQGAIPTFKGYRNFPATICASVNEEGVHGIPNKQKVLKDGDVLSLDIGVTFRRQTNGKKFDFIGDT